MPVVQVEPLESRTLLAAGDLDTGFGGGGLISVGGLGGVVDIAAGPDGMIFVVSGYGVHRLNPDGSPDISAGEDGTIEAPINAEVVEIQADGKIIVGGIRHSSAGPQFALARLNPDGTPDHGFSEDGVAELEFELCLPGGGQVSDLLVQNDGRIVAVGSVHAKSSFRGRAAVARFMPDGAPDPSFSGDGLVTAALPRSITARATSVAVQSDGGVVVAVKSNTRKSTESLILRFTSDGRLDRRFSGNGLRRVHSRRSADFIDSGRDPRVAVQSTGRIVYFAGDRGYVSALTAAGAPDKTFRTQRAVFDTGWAYDMALMTDDRIIVVGEAEGGETGTLFAVARFQDNGRRDRTFNGGRFVTTDWTYRGCGGDTATEVAILPDGDVLAGGWYHGAFCAPLGGLARYQSG